MEDWDITSTTEEHPAVKPMFTTRTRKSEEKDREDQFETTMDEMTGKTDAVEMKLPGEQISCTADGMLDTEVLKGRTGDTGVELLSEIDDILSFLRY
jgi:hypothetical protein